MYTIIHAPSQNTKAMSETDSNSKRKRGTATEEPKIMINIEKYFCLVNAYKIPAVNTEQIIGIVIRKKSILVRLYQQRTGW